MAQAARLSLRMQKELKLLLTDPPPHASFPNLSSSSSLSTIHAQIEGPENTVYANGKFHIKIQIPDRYPFQPPIVTFVTPVYHPNIDNGGRICLDILNLPPKGAWQPSLNISTVLTSIGLLLSEPNPDDGLMCEASREYKYNRQTFDQKARSMTEKYAKAGCSGSVSGSQSNEKIPISDSVEARTDKESMPELNESAAGDTKPHGINQKLLLDISGLKRKEICNGPVSVVPDHFPSMPNPENTSEAEKIQNKPERLLAGSDVIAENLRGTKRKLSLSYSGQTSKIHINNEITASNFSSAVLDKENFSVVSSGLSVVKADNSYNQQSHQNLNSQVLNESKTDLKELGQNADSRVCLFPSSLSQDANVKDGLPHMGYTNKKGTNDTRRKRLTLGLKNLSQPVAMQSKENVVPISYSPLPNSRSPYGKSRMNQKPTSGPLERLQGSNNEYSNSYSLAQDPSYSSMFPSKQQQCRFSRQQSENVGNIEEKSKQQGTEDLLLSETVVVLDSEDSEEESDRSSRPRLLARKGMRNWKSKC